MPHLNTSFVVALLSLGACSTGSGTVLPTGRTGPGLTGPAEPDAPRTGAAPVAADAPPSPSTFAASIVGDGVPPAGEPPQSSARRWDKGEALLQGFLGATLFEEIKRSGGSTPTVDGSDDDLAQMPVIGGGGQWKLAGKDIDFGLEGLLAFNWRSGGTAVVAGGGGAAVAVDVDMLLFELYGGPFLSKFLGDSLRVYAGAGPLMQWANYEQSGSSYDGDGNGFGVGYYARAGLEFDIGGNSLLGFGVRWADSSVDLNGDQGTLDLASVQFAVTFSRWY